MPRDYSEYDMDEPRRILVLDENGVITNIIWASINFCLSYYASEDMWDFDPVDAPTPWPPAPAPEPTEPVDPDPEPTNPEPTDPDPEPEN